MFQRRLYGVVRRRRPKNPTILSEILQIVRTLDSQGKEPTFNTILYELSSRGILQFHRALREYLDLLVHAKLLTVTFEETFQPNIRKRQVYRINPLHNQPIIEAGEKALLLHGLNWNVPSPMSVSATTDLRGLALSTISNTKVYASLEDAIVQSLKILPKRHPQRASELIVFATALIATQKIDFDYLLARAKQAGVERETMGILLSIDRALTSPHPDVEDIRTLYELRKLYQHARRQLLKSIQRAATGTTTTDRQVGKMPSDVVVSSNEVIEYAGKQLGIRG
jgi:hypothetical protein